MLGEMFQTLVRTAPTDEVARIADEADPREAGLTREDVDAIWRAAVGVYRSGLYPAVQLCLRRRGKVVLDSGTGHPRGNAPDDAPDAHKTIATPKTLFNLFSAS